MADPFVRASSIDGAGLPCSGSYPGPASGGFLRQALVESLVPVGAEGTAAMESQRWFRPEDLSGVEALHLTASSRLWRVYHDTYVACVTERGGGDWWYRGRVSRSAPG